ncbi:acyltransferase [Clostridium botulinum]|uniref:MBOAT family O-acyltransferase n=1 Tax=Clostridium botulinum TaxID=1491 RepID=UPI000174E246|nr:MBOAT family O-acyltransferase [Clostridium botulinum]ACD52930.1 membrane-bound O-acyltransferase family protein [Clostridium botulinum E3 str. Alaska E43]AJF30799.1 acyltransferase [Clostridium botulinum]AJF33862.1 acyltransferase [Clostridium botulinum]MBY6787973.1 MBOAT family protein [Clostridium botulinum]MBY6815614.1 MBOAT family protein [Clostridium botulinum]
MSFLQFNFWVFLLVAITTYYILPKRYQWICLLISSYVFYTYTGIKTVGYILFTTITTWVGALFISKIEEQKKNELLINKELLTSKEKKEIKQLVKKKQRKILGSVLLINFVILAFLKYFNFAAENINYLFNIFSENKTNPIKLGLLLPLGISFYTFQSVGYLIDVYNGKYKAEKNLPKFALFVSFFPQIIQGPINRFDKLGSQLYEHRNFDLKKFQYGIQLILWGLFKKLVIADRAIVIVNQIFDNHKNYGGGLIVLGVLFYSLQQYTDFSGGIDIAMGIAELFGIHMSENFKRPYFSTSLSEFWRRWHITLGAWMRDYVFYPLALTKRMSKITKLANKYLGKRIGKVVPVALANIVVFLIVGIWHGPYWHYVAWGLYNGIIIAISALSEPIYECLRKSTKVNTKCFSYKLFQILRTFFIVNLGWYFDRGNGLCDSFQMLHNTITNFNVIQLLDGTILKLGLKNIDFKILIFATVVLFAVSVIQESGIKVREFLSEQNLVFRWIILYLLIFMIIGLTYSSGNAVGGFMYAQF